MLFFEGMKFLMRTLPLLGVERKTQKYRFFRTVVSKVTFGGIMSVLASTLKDMPSKDLEDAAKLQALGEGALALFQQAEVEVQTAV